MSCCGQELCAACHHRWFFDETENPVQQTCPLCRERHYTEEEELEALRIHASNGKPWAHYNLARLLSSEDAGEEALEHSLLSLADGELKSYRQLGLMYFREGIFAKTLQYWREGSNLGIEVCSYLLAKLYLKIPMIDYIVSLMDSDHSPEHDSKINRVMTNFNDFTSDFPKVVHYMEVAANQQSFDAKYMLGKWYLNGEMSLEINKDKGIELLTDAADNGHNMAQYHLGVYYFSERSIPQAICYLEKASVMLTRKDPNYHFEIKSDSEKEGGEESEIIVNEEAHLKLAECYLLNDAPVEAFYWFKRYETTHPGSCDDKIKGIVRTLQSCCSNCQKEKKKTDKPLAVCGGCGVVSFCNKKCQQAHWTSHKEICKKIKYDKMVRAVWCTEKNREEYYDISESYYITSRLMKQPEMQTFFHQNASLVEKARFM